MPRVASDSLSLFLGGYCDQDWDYSYPTIWDAVDDYLASEPRSERHQAAVDLREKILDKSFTETELDRVFLSIGCAYDPPRDGMTHRAWLEEVERRIAGSLQPPESRSSGHPEAASA